MPGHGETYLVLRIPGNVKARLPEIPIPLNLGIDIDTLNYSGLSIIILRVAPEVRATGFSGF